MSLNAIKKNVGVAAANLIQDGMVVGLGTGTTAAHFIEALIQRCKEGLKIHAVASSLESLQLAKRGKIPILDINHITSLDVTVDGADEIDPQKRMIKGAGGALVREKIVANMSHEMIVIVDESKLVAQLGKCKLPVEIIPFATAATKHQLEKLGYPGEWRKKNGSFYITENNNYILDISFKEPLTHPEQIHEAMIHLPGVVDTGFFFHLAGRVITGFKDGQVTIN